MQVQKAGREDAANLLKRLTPLSAFLSDAEQPQCLTWLDKLDADGHPHLSLKQVQVQRRLTMAGQEQRKLQVQVCCHSGHGARSRIFQPNMSLWEAAKRKND